MSGRLTAGKFAIYSLRAHKKQYRALTAGIALAIFFMSLMLALGQSVYLTYRENHWRQVGKHDVTLFDSEAVTRQSLLEGGYVSAAGSAYVIGEEADTGVAIGYYDEPGEQLAYWQVVEGRMPQSAGEIAVERAKLRRLKRDAQLGDRLTLKIKIPSGGGAFLPDVVEKSYVLV
ncbi:MAG: hypothetical protein GX558_01630, partial [Clostridiales bacterium]|nr:hypothetical protein [Clostridiales bacterium]